MKNKTITKMIRTRSEKIITVIMTKRKNKNNDNKDEKHEE